MQGRKLLRQGDVLLVPVDELPLDGQRIHEDDEAVELVLAEGEATGHAHVVEGERVRRVVLHRPRRWMVPLASVWLVVEKPGATLRHDEHLPIRVAAGVYEVRRQREYTASAARQVMD